MGAKLETGSSKPPRILVIDDQPDARRSLQRCLSQLGCTVETAPSGEAGLECIQQRHYDLVITDLVMPEMDGIAVIRSARRFDPQARVVVLTGHGSVQTAVEAMQEGAADYLTKPLRMDETRLVLNRTLQRGEAVGIESPRGNAKARPAIIADSKAMKKVLRLVQQIAGTNANVLVEGESGTGKELVARQIHDQSARRDRNFVCVNCAALTETLLANELFGHEAESFTGARKRKSGLVEGADQGTLFLDEIGETDASFQTAVLRVLQERELLRVGGTEPVNVDFRLIASTNKRLTEEVAAGRFREDLYYRLNVVSVHLPPLRQRKDDIPPMVKHFLQLYGEQENRPAPLLEPRALALLMDYDWPGNVRELENAVQRAVVLSPSGRIGPEQLPPMVQERTRTTRSSASASAPSRSLREAKEEFERDYLEQLLRETQGNVSQAATRAKVGRTYLHEKIRKLGLEPSTFRG